MESGVHSDERCRILVADDDTTTLLLYRAALGSSRVGNPHLEATSAAGDCGQGPTTFELTVCRQGDEAVRAVEEAVAEGGHYSVAFLDVLMPPGPDGVWAAERIRALDPGTQIILVTAMSDIDPEEIARKIPPPDKLLYVQKPLDPLELQSLAAAFGSKWRMERLVQEYQDHLERKVAERTAELGRLNQQLQDDIAERRRVEEALRKSQSSLTRAQQMAHLGSWEVDLATGALTCSDEMLRILNRPYSDPPRTIGAFLESVHAHDRHELEEWLTQGSKHNPFLSTEHRIVHSDGSERIVHQLIELVHDPARRPIELRGAMQDITEVKRSEEQIAYQAYHDALTDLPNRQLFNDRLQIAMAHARRRHQRLSVLFLDLDDFKTVNDSLGHAIGDLLLQEVAKRLLASVREEDTVARAGGDEFLILLQDVTDPSFVVQVAERILSSLTDPFLIEEHELYVGASIGITFFPDDALSPEVLISNADIAMYRAKEHGRNCFKLFTPAMNVMVMKRMDLELSLRKALKQREFLLHYQPVVDIASGQAVGVEALLRWHRPDVGLVGPDAFIPLAEETGLIVPIGEWVLRTACSSARYWHEQGLDHLMVSVNLSPRQFQVANLAALVEKILAETGLPPRFLALEVTEGAVMHNVEEAIRTMETLSELGVRLSMDDFGRGYSSLCHLKRFPMHTLKIDRSFVSELSASPDDASIVRAIISLSRSLSLKVVAEGVETHEQLDFLRYHECDQVQGFLFGRPAPAELIGEIVRSKQRPGSNLGTPPPTPER